MPMAARKKPTKKYREMHVGKVEKDDEYGLVLFLVEQKFNDCAYGISSGGLVDARLVGKRVKVTVEEL